MFNRTLLHDVGWRALSFGRILLSHIGLWMVVVFGTFDFGFDYGLTIMVRFESTVSYKSKLVFDHILILADWFKYFPHFLVRNKYEFDLIQFIFLCRKQKKNLVGSSSSSGLIATSLNWMVLWYWKVLVKVVDIKVSTKFCLPY